MKSPATDTLETPYAELGARTRAQVEVPLFLALCRVTSTDPDLLTPPAKSHLTRALNHLRRATPALTVEDLERAGLAFRARFPTADLTPAQLVQQWARINWRATAHHPLIEPEPKHWREWINVHTPDAPYARGGAKAGTAWHDLDAFYRRYLVEQCKRSA